MNELLDRFGSSAVVAARPRLLGSGETYRWELEIDGERIPGVSVHERAGNRPGERELWMVYADREIKLGRWQTSRYPDSPAAVVRTLGDVL